jgi:hypothetical protein
MTAAEATRLAQTDPVPNLTGQAGQLAADARRKLDNLIYTLRELDKIRGTLAEHDITLEVDLGPIGNAAAAARRDLEKQRDQPTFKLPATDR